MFGQLSEIDKQLGPVNLKMDKKHCMWLAVLPFEVAIYIFVAVRQQPKTFGCVWSL
jgi:hypothetical protein